MKYILAQNGHVYSVGQLMPPRKDPNVITFKVWKLSLVAPDGQEHVYATYDNGGDAINAYNFVISFIRSSYSMLEFPGGKGSWPRIYEKRNLGLSRNLDYPVSKPYNPEGPLEGPISRAFGATTNISADMLKNVLVAYGVDSDDPFIENVQKKLEEAIFRNRKSGRVDDPD